MCKSKHKYLTDLGIEPCLSSLNDWRTPRLWIRCFKRWRYKRKYGFDPSETWALDTYMSITLLERLVAFKELNCIDMTYHSMEIEGQMMTMEETLDLLINLLIKGIKEEEETYFIPSDYLRRAWFIWSQTLHWWWW